MTARSKSENLSLLWLIFLCSSGFLLMRATLYNNIHLPNLIPYFNADEGYLMDVIWFYFSGEIRPGYVGNVDYGLQLLYISDLCRHVLSRFFDFTPGIFVLILRWFHLLSWIGCIIVLWRLVGRHFGLGWPQMLCVSLLASRPSLAYYTASSKPDFLVLFFMILGLDYTLRLIDSSQRKYLMAAASCAALSVIVKFGGFFLLPAIVAALFFRTRYGVEKPPRGRMKSLAMPILLWGLLMLAPMVGLSIYVREASGLTYIQEFGFWQSLLKLKIILILWSAISVWLAGYLFFFVFYKSRSPLWAKTQHIIGEFSSHTATVLTYFSMAMIIFGFRWLITPGHLIHTYLQNGMDFSGGYILKDMASIPQLIHGYGMTVINRFIGFDLFVVLLFFLYLILEIHTFRKNSAADKLLQYKRFTLLIYLVPFLMAMFSPGRFTQHHALPFFVAISILISEGLKLLKLSRWRNGHSKVVCALVVILITDICWFSWKTASARLYQARQQEDIAYEFADWLRTNIRKGEVMVTDHPTRIYVPEDYPHIVIFKKGYLPDRIEQLKKLIDDKQPKYVYYNTGRSGSQRMPDLRVLLPDRKIKLIKNFDSRERGYRRAPDDRFVVYEL